MVEIIEYSEKSIAVIGDTKPLKNVLYNLKGRFNSHLTHPESGEKICGWIFSKKRKENVETVLNKKPDYESDLDIGMWAWITQRDRLRSVAKKILEVSNIRSVVQDDPVFFGKEAAEKGPKFRMFGRGCGHVWLEVRKKTKAEKALKDCQAIMFQCDAGGFTKYVARLWESFTPDETEYLRSISFPFLSILAQDMDVKSVIACQQADYIEQTFGNKKINIRSRMD